MSTFAARKAKRHPELVAAEPLPRVRAQRLRSTLNRAVAAAPALEAARTGSQPHFCFSTFPKDLQFSENGGTSLYRFIRLLNMGFSAAC